MAIVSTKAKGLAISVDAFGTLYRPKEPIGAQYLKMAKECGLDANIKHTDLESSFRLALKDTTTKCPVYGEKQGMKPEQWWQEIVHSTFRPLSQGHPIPSSLAPRLYRHFSTKDAYALYPDVLPFLTQMRKLKQRFQDPEGPIVLLGIITNSDDRVQSIIRSFGLRVGPTDAGTASMKGIVHRHKDTIHASITAARNGVMSPPQMPTRDMYDANVDVDFLLTSYDTGCEKPHDDIFAMAVQMTAVLAASRREQSPEFMSRISRGALQSASQGVYLNRIHVGDDYSKDYLGAKDSSADYEALHLCRNTDRKALENHQISSLEELGTYVNMMADVNFARP